MEYCENGSLSNILHKFGTFPETLVSLYIGQVLDGLEYLHKQGVIHGDVKAANILSTKSGTVKLADFGISAKLATGLSERDKNIVGSPFWMSPEIIELKGAFQCSDVWSVGCTIVELLDGQPPYYSLDPMSVLFNIVQDDHPPLPKATITKDLTDFLLNCWIRDSSKRPSAAQLLTHSWMRNSQHRKILAASKPAKKPTIPTGKVGVDAISHFIVPETQCPHSSDWDQDFVFGSSAEDQTADSVRVHWEIATAGADIRKQHHLGGFNSVRPAWQRHVFSVADESWDDDFDVDESDLANHVLRTAASKKLSVPQRVFGNKRSSSEEASCDNTGDNCAAVDDETRSWHDNPTSILANYIEDSPRAQHDYSMDFEDSTTSTLDKLQPRLFLAHTITKSVRLIHIIIESGRLGSNDSLPASTRTACAQLTKLFGDCPSIARDAFVAAGSDAIAGVMDAFEAAVGKDDGDLFIALFGQMLVCARGASFVSASSEVPDAEEFHRASLVRDLSALGFAQRVARHALETNEDGCASQEPTIYRNHGAGTRNVLLGCRQQRMSACLRLITVFAKSASAAAEMDVWRALLLLIEEGVKRLHLVPCAIGAACAAVVLLRGQSEAECTSRTSALKQHGAALRWLMDWWDVVRRSQGEFAALILQIVDMPSAREVSECLQFLVLEG
ncbi:hypothetical protein HDU83_002345, partial [Entophlyctis luteolus]